eukprot:GFYU01008206.1.p1 GENE.GFYU01008206.1~~GFYU01008206.1.p1  ORF type:complete len:343 (-),score=66.41 GFYU01008206.1:153-1181(-)
MLLQVYNEWRTARAMGNQDSFCRENFLSSTVLVMIDNVRDQFLSLLTGELGMGSLSRICRNDANVTCVKAVITAGLFPNVISVFSKQKQGKSKRSLAEGESSDARMLTQTGTPVSLHPLSVNARQPVTHGWLVYFEMVKSNGVLVRDCTSADPLMMILFGGPPDLLKFKPDKAGRKKMATLKLGKFQFSVNATCAKQLWDLRHCVDALLECKFDPCIRQRGQPTGQRSGTGAVAASDSDSLDATQKVSVFEEDAILRMIEAHGKRLREQNTQNYRPPSGGRGQGGAKRGRGGAGAGGSGRSKNSVGGGNSKKAKRIAKQKERAERGRGRGGGAGGGRGGRSK